MSRHDRPIPVDPELDRKARERALAAEEAATQKGYDAFPFGHPAANVRPPGPTIGGHRIAGVADVHREEREARLRGDGK